MDLLSLIAPALAGVIASVLTYLATRRQAQLAEREVYIKAVEGLTAGLQAEIERVGADRQGLSTRVEELEARIRHHEQAEAVLKGKVRELMMRIEQLEAERDRLQAHLNQENQEERL